MDNAAGQAAFETWVTGYCGNRRRRVRRRWFCSRINCRCRSFQRRSAMAQVQFPYVRRRKRVGSWNGRTCNRNTICLLPTRLDRARFVRQSALLPSYPPSYSDEFGLCALEETREGLWPWPILAANISETLARMLQIPVNALAAIP